MQYTVIPRSQGKSYREINSQNIINKARLSLKMYTRDLQEGRKRETKE